MFISSEFAQLNTEHEKYVCIAPGRTVKETCKENIAIYGILWLHFLVLCSMVSFFELKTWSGEMPGHYKSHSPINACHILFLMLRERRGAFLINGFAVEQTKVYSS